MASIAVRYREQFKIRVDHHDFDHIEYGIYDDGSPSTKRCCHQRASYPFTTYRMVILHVEMNRHRMRAIFSQSLVKVLSPQNGGNVRAFP
jgi:hypothetical protein